MSCVNCNIARSRGYIFCPFCGERIENTNYQNVQNENQIPQQTVNQNYISQQPLQNNQQYGQPGYQQNYNQQYGQPGYQQNYNQQYGQPQYYQQSNLQVTAKPKGRRVSVTALLGFIFSFLGLFFWIPALVLGIIGFKKTKTSDDRVYNVTLNKVFSIIAITLSSLFLGIFTLVQVVQIGTMFAMI